MDHTHRTLVVVFISFGMRPSVTTLRSIETEHGNECPSHDKHDGDSSDDLGLDSVPFDADADADEDEGEGESIPQSSETQESPRQDREKGCKGKGTGRGKVDRNELYGWGGTIGTPPRVWVPRTPNAPVKTRSIDLRTLKHELDCVFYEPPIPTFALRFTTPLRLPPQPSTPCKVKIRHGLGSLSAPRALVFL